MTRRRRGALSRRNFRAGPQLAQDALYPAVRSVAAAGRVADACCASTAPRTAAAVHGGRGVRFHVPVFLHSQVVRTAFSPLPHIIVRQWSMSARLETKNNFVSSFSRMLCSSQFNEGIFGKKIILKLAVKTVLSLRRISFTWHNFQGHTEVVSVTEFPSAVRTCPSTAEVWLHESGCVFCFVVTIGKQII